MFLILLFFHALFGDNTFSMGAVIAKRLSLNHTKGPIFGGIYDARLAKHFEIPIRHYDTEETLLPPTFLDYRSMVVHEFLVKDKNKILKYKLIFNKNCCEFITLHAPSLFNIFSGMYLVLPEAIHAYRSLTSAPEPEPEPPLDPHCQSIY